MESLHVMSLERNLTEFLSFEWLYRYKQTGAGSFSDEIGQEFRERTTGAIINLIGWAQSGKTL